MQQYSVCCRGDKYWNVLSKKQMTEETGNPSDLLPEDRNWSGEQSRWREGWWAACRSAWEWRTDDSMG